MARTITVKGIGKVSAKPDYVVFSMTLESKHMKNRRSIWFVLQTKVNPE